MAALNGRRPRRINNDGKSITEVGKAAVALLPGSFAKLNATGQFRQAVVADKKPIYIINVDDLTGQDILTAVPAGESATGDYVEEARQFAALVAPGTVCIKDTPFKRTATGTLTLADPADEVYAYSMEIYTVPALPATGSHVRVRIA